MHRGIDIAAPLNECRGLDPLARNHLRRISLRIKGNGERWATRLRADILLIHLVSSHALREGRDLPERIDHPAINVFQATRPVRGATGSSDQHGGHSEFQSTRPVRGATNTAKRTCQAF